VKSVEEAIEYVNSRHTPLALYLFGKNVHEHEIWIKKTKSGGLTINDCLLHVVQDNLPFGGVGTSGYGHYHGKWGFENFSKQKPIFVQSKINATSFFKPPYGKTFNKLAKYLVFWV
jgi:coniferyl-aldehyde dehydrogenase